MKANFDGMRRNATGNLNRLHNIVDTIVRFQKIDNDLKEELIESFNETAMSVDMFNCLFDNDVTDDMNDLSDKLYIKRIED